jgi:hypothetical protein
MPPLAVFCKKCRIVDRGCGARSGVDRGVGLDVEGRGVLNVEEIAPCARI